MGMVLKLALLILSAPSANANANANPLKKQQTSSPPTSFFASDDLVSLPHSAAFCVSAMLCCCQRCITERVLLMC